MAIRGWDRMVWVDHYHFTQQNEYETPSYDTIDLILLALCE